MVTRLMTLAAAPKASIGAVSLCAGLTRKAVHQSKVTVVMCVLVILHLETGVAYSRNWLPSLYGRPGAVLLDRALSLS